MEIKYNVQAPPKKSFQGGTKSEEIKAIEDQRERKEYVFPV